MNPLHARIFLLYKMPYKVVISTEFPPLREGGNWELVVAHQFPRANGWHLYLGGVSH
jgi:hypothetical protein